MLFCSCSAAGVIVTDSGAWGTYYFLQLTESNSDMSDLTTAIAACYARSTMRGGN